MPVQNPMAAFWVVVSRASDEPLEANARSLSKQENWTAAYHTSRMTVARKPAYSPAMPRCVTTLRTAAGAERWRPSWSCDLTTLIGTRATAEATPVATPATGVCSSAVPRAASLQNSYVGM
eukprot:4380156-Prymnesium_polylepis.1